MSKEDWVRDYESCRESGMGQGDAIRCANEQFSPAGNAHVAEPLRLTLNGFFSACATQSVNCDERPVAEVYTESTRRREIRQDIAAEINAAQGLELTEADVQWIAREYHKRVSR